MTLIELFGLIRKHLKLMVLLPVVCALAVGVFSWGFMSDTYTSSVSMYVLTRAAGDTSTSISNSELSASQMLTNDIAKLIKSDRVLGDAASSLSMRNLDGYDVAIASDTSTRIITISVTGEDARSVASVANALAETADGVAQEIMDIESINVIDEAEQSNKPSGPPRLTYTLVAFLAGIFLAIALIVIMDMVNTRVRSPEEAEELLGVPIIGRIPTIKG